MTKLARFIKALLGMTYSYICERCGENHIRLLGEKPDCDYKKGR